MTQRQYRESQNQNYVPVPMPVLIIIIISIDVIIIYYSQTMPSRQDMNSAQQRGRMADELMEESLTGAASHQLAAPLPTNQQANNLFGSVFGDNNTAADPVDPGVNSRTGQRVSAAAGNSNQVYVTDAHASVQDRPARGRGSGGRGTPGRGRGRGGRGSGGRGTRGRGRGNGGRGQGRAQRQISVNNAAINQTIDIDDVPDDVLEEMHIQEQIDGVVHLMDDEAIDADIQHVLRSRIAKKTRENYTSLLLN